MLEAKDKVQKECWDLWKKNNYVGTIVAGTGVGKTRIGVVPVGEFLKQRSGERWIVVVPRENLRDNEWPNEFKRWGYKDALKHVEITCIQSLYKIKGENYDGLVCDEVHEYIGTDEYGAFLRDNGFRRKLCLTATPPEDENKLAALQEFAPILKVITSQQAVEMGLIAPYQGFNLAVPFTPTEAAEYRRINNAYNYAAQILGGSSVAYQNHIKFRKYNIHHFVRSMAMTGMTFIDKASENAYVASKAQDPSIITMYNNYIATDKYKEMKQYSFVYAEMMRKRKELLYSTISKVHYTEAIIQKFANRKALVFSETTKFADAVSKRLGDIAVTYHSKLSKKERKETLRKFRDGRTKQRVIVSVKALNAGTNVPDCSLGICAAGTSKALDNIQRRGRALRLMEGKVAIYVNLYVPDTQEYKWVVTRTKEDKNIKWIKSLDEIHLDD